VASLKDRRKKRKAATKRYTARPEKHIKDAIPSCITGTLQLNINILSDVCIVLVDLNPTMIAVALGYLAARITVCKCRVTPIKVERTGVHISQIFFSATGYRVSLKTTSWNAETLLRLPEDSRRHTKRREPFPDSLGHGPLRRFAFEHSRKTETFFSEQITGHVSFPRDILVTDVFM